MNKLQQITAYFCTHYPHKSELSKARLTKFVYLADWFGAMLDNHQMTDIEWMFNHYGPFVDDVYENANPFAGFTRNMTETGYGTPKYLIGYNGPEEFPDLTKREQEILDAIINKTKSMYFNEFIKYVYSTYPVASNERYSTLDLLSLAQEYNQSKSKEELAH